MGRSGRSGSVGRAQRSERVLRLQVVAEPAETWAPAMAKQYQALVIAAGD